MFSKDFEFNQAVSATQLDQSGRQLPAVQHLPNVVRTLWQELRMLERHVSVSSNEIVLRTGDASIVMKADGTIVIRGRELSVEGTGNVTAKAGNNLVLKGSKIVEN